MTKKLKAETSVLLKLLFSAICLFAILPAAAQENPEKAAREARKFMSDAEEALEEEDFATAEAYYRKAISKDPANASARYNLGNLYHNKELTGEAIERDSQAAKIAEEKPLKHKSFHNKGNAYMEQKKYPEAIEAYKDALRNNPSDEETRYNLALAKKLWEKEKQGGGNDDNQNKQDNEKEHKENQEQQGDQGDQEQDQQGNPQDQEGGDQQDEQKQDPKEEGEGEQKQEQQEGEGKQPQQTPQQQPQPVPGQLSPQQVKNLLEAMGNEEKKVQEKMNAEKERGIPTRAAKDW